MLSYSACGIRWAWGFRAGPADRSPRSSVREGPAAPTISTSSSSSDISMTSGCGRAMAVRRPGLRAGLVVRECEGGRVVAVDAISEISLSEDGDRNALTRSMGGIWRCWGGAGQTVGGSVYALLAPSGCVAYEEASLRFCVAQERIDDDKSRYKVGSNLGQQWPAGWQVAKRVQKQTCGTITIVCTPTISTL